MRRFLVITLTVLFSLVLLSPLQPAAAATDHRLGADWCQNHGAIVSQIDHDITNWAGCLAWCDTVMNQSVALCQYNGDGIRNCWTTYAPGGVNGTVDNCNWIPGNVSRGGLLYPMGAWYSGFSPALPDTAIHAGIDKWGILAISGVVMVFILFSDKIWKALRPARAIQSSVN